MVFGVFPLPLFDLGTGFALDRDGPRRGRWSRPPFSQHQDRHAFPRPGLWSIVVILLSQAGAPIREDFTARQPITGTMGHGRRTFEA